MAEKQALKHIAFIMDGNGRWATNRKRPRLEGHKAGSTVVRQVLRWAQAAHLECVTFYAFSVENWKRTEEEVSGLFELFRYYFKKELSNLKQENVRVRFIGDRSPMGKLPKDILNMMNGIEDDTRHCTGVTAVFAINYGGRDELVRAAMAVAQDVSAGRTFMDDIDEIRFANYLDTADLPEVDLIVRTAGEKRLSNFLLWQASYAELAFVDVLWPDLDERTFKTLLSEYYGRNRKFGAMPTVALATELQSTKVEAF